MFCWIDSAQCDGLGKIVQMHGAKCVVEFFDSPDNVCAHRVSVPISSIRRKRLGRNTRVFTFDEASNLWTIGRVREDDGEGIEVRLSHKRDVYLSYEKIFVRWKRPIEDPVAFLGNFITETPQYAEARSGFMQSYIFQRGASYGISALLSSSIELEPHQVDVVRRVLTDHTQRYLLADEVGLGKTIEAGIIIRQTVLDDIRGHRILILVPRELVNQWREELTARFGLSDFLDDSVFVLAQENSAELCDVSRNISLLVVDEAHHLTAPNANESVRRFYELVQVSAQRAERLLLLSATPILRNESGFHRMLNLLDPVVYPLDDLEGFRTKVSNRQALAETVAALDPSNSLFMDSVLDDLLDRLPDDPRLSELCSGLKEQLQGIPDESNQEFCASVRQLRAHISETYRLNRRILRNRRTQVAGLTPERKGAEIWWVDSSSMDRVEASLEDWRVRASLAMSDEGFEGASDVEEFYWNAVTTLSEGSSGLTELFSRRKARIERGELKSFDGEQTSIEAIIRAVDFETWIERRLDRLYQGLLALPEGAKVVIFCADETNADSVFRFLNDRKVNVLRHGDNLETSRQGSWRESLDATEVRAIVGGPRAEEGVNLQGGNKVIVHFDVPLQPNRVEQRMGRVDRYGAGRPVPSFVLVDKKAPLQLAWFSVLDEGLGVFDRSISSLQYLVDEELNTLSRTLVKDGAEGFDSLRDRLGGSNGNAAQELRLIDQQDALDQLSPIPEKDLDDLFDADAEWRDILQAMTYWIEETLLFDKVKLPRPEAATTIDDPFRFAYCPPDSGTGRTTLIPLAEFLEDFLGAIDLDAPGSRSSRPLSYPYVAHRPSAVKRGIRPLRYGTEFVESVRSFSELDVRGKSFAMWRQVPGVFQSMEIRTCFRFDFFVETRLDEALDVLVQAHGSLKESARSSLARRGDSLFRPTVIQIWLDGEGDELPAEFIEKYLLPEYAKEGGDGYLDKNLDTSLLTAFRRFSPDMLGNWSNRCDRMRCKAKEVAMSKPELSERQFQALCRAQAEDEIREAQLLTRIQSLDGREADAEGNQLTLTRSLNEALHRGISKPSVKVDVAGVVFLTSEPLSIMDDSLKVQG